MNCIVYGVKCWWVVILVGEFIDKLGIMLGGGILVKKGFMFFKFVVDIIKE